MNKKLFLTALAFLLALTFSVQSAHAQVNTTADHGKTKTVVYKIKQTGEQKPITAQQAIDVDKLLPTKKGVISSITNSTNRMVSVKMETGFPEQEIKKLLGEVFKLEVESYEIIDNSK